MRHGFVIPFSEDSIPEPLNNDTAIKLCEQYRNGQKDVRDALIEGHIYFAMWIVTHYVGRHSDRAEDLASSALFGLVQAVEWAPERMRDNNITAYIATTIRRHIRDFIEQDNMIRIPRKTYKKMIQDGLAAGYDLKDIVPVIHIFDTQISEDEDEGVNDYYDLFEPGVIDQEEIIAKDLLDHLHLDVKEEQVVNSLVEGWTIRDIASQLGISKSSVYNVIKSIRERIKLLGEEYASEHGGARSRTEACLDT